MFKLTPNMETKEKKIQSYSKPLSHTEALKLLGYEHESDLQFDLYDFRNVIHAGDVINVVRFLEHKGFKIIKPLTQQP